MKSGKKIAANEIYALAFGLFLGLCILKFGNPVILDRTISPPASLSEYWADSWPLHWANWFLVPLAAIGAVFMALMPASQRPRCPRWLLVLPLLWLGWQFISASQTVDATLTALTLWQFFGCVACYFIGLFLFGSPRALHFLLAGILTAFAICLIQAVHQHIEFPQDEKLLIEGQRVGWTNFPPQAVLEMKRDQTIITTNGMEVANPVIIAKFAKGRVMGTLIYPNALAGIVLLLFPISLVLVVNGAKTLRPLVAVPAIGVTVALAGPAFFWSGSKFGWLIALLMVSLCLFRFHWPMKFKILALVMAVVLGLGIFALRFHNYFENGATSAAARLDYWHAAVQTACTHPLFGTGPGTFQRPYAEIKLPDAEMARLAHNDYLEQFSDSGFIGGIFYLVWIVAALIYAGRGLWKLQNQTVLALVLGLLGWFVQGLGEFGLFIPALAWTAFAFLGCALALKNTENPTGPGSESIRQKARHG